MIRKDATIQNGHGIHCRPSAVIFKAIEGYKGEISILTGGMDILLESIMSLLALGLRKGMTITVQVSGPNEELVCGKIVEMFEFVYDFPPHEKNPGFDPEEIAQKFRLPE